MVKILLMTLWFALCILDILRSVYVLRYGQVVIYLDIYFFSLKSIKILFVSKTNIKQVSVKSFTLICNSYIVEQIIVGGEIRNDIIFEDKLTMDQSLNSVNWWM
jgi:ribosomal protein S2